MASNVHTKYDKDGKGTARETAIKHAIHCLTAERSTSACVQRNFPRDLWNQSLATEKHNWSSETIQSMNESLKDWEQYRDSKILATGAGDLRVLSLGGDDPTKDIKVLTENGVSARRIWITEKKNRDFQKGKEAVRGSSFSEVKLVKINLLTFLEEDRGEPFDIINIDTCGSLPAESQETLRIIGRIFQLNKLASPGALITNFSFPPKELAGCEERQQIAYIAREYLKNKIKDITGCYNDVFWSQKTDEEIYSDYVTIQVIDSASFFIPAQRMFLSSNKWSDIFEPTNFFFKEVSKHPPHSVGSTSEVSEGCTNSSKQDAGMERNIGCNDCEELYNNFYLSKISLAMEVEKDKNRFCTAWLDEVFPSLTANLKKIKVSSLVLTALLFSSTNFFLKFANYNFKQCIKSLKHSEDKTLIAGLLYGLSAEPSYPVLDKLRRLYYTEEKQRQMFCDVFIFDRCRYLFELFPFVHTVEQFCDKKENVFLIAKMILDGMEKHLKCICKKDLFNVNLRCQFGLDETDTIVKELPLPKRKEVCVEKTKAAVTN